MTKLNLLLYSSQYPTKNDPSGGVFTQQLAHALAMQVAVTVVCPLIMCPDLAWTRKNPRYRRYVNSEPRTREGNVEIYYPKYLVVPKVSGLLLPTLQATMLYGFMQRLHRAKNFDAVNAQWFYPDGVAATWLAQRLRLPIMLTALGSDINTSAEQAGRLAQIRWAIRTANAVSGVSRALAKKLVTLGANENSVHYIPNGVNATQFGRLPAMQIPLQKERLGLDPCKRYVIFVGRFHPVKGLKFLIEALAQLAARNKLNFNTLLVGGGEQESELRSTIQQQNLDGVVQIVGHIPHSEVCKWLQIADVFCLPSLMEGMPNVVLEAQACGLPVVATSVGGLPDLVQNDTGLLVQPGNSTALAEALHCAIQSDWRPSDIVSKTARPDWNQIATQYLVAIEKMLSREKPGHHVQVNH